MDICGGKILKFYILKNPLNNQGSDTNEKTQGYHHIYAKYS
jgi:hypothetical protein